MGALDAVKEGLALGGMLVAVVGAGWWLVKPRAVEWLQRHLIDPVQETHHSVTVNGHTSEEPTLLDRVEGNTQAIRTMQGVVQVVANELARHDREARESVIAYRAALEEQGIHLPLVPAELRQRDDDPPEDED